MTATEEFYAYTTFEGVKPGDQALKFTADNGTLTIAIGVHHQPPTAEYKINKGQLDYLMKNVLPVLRNWVDSGRPARPAQP